MSQPAPTIETSPRAGHDAPVVEAKRDGDNPRHFVISLLVAFVVVLLGTFTFNVIVDPYGTVGTGLFKTGIPEDPAIKVGLIQHLKAPPHLIVLGSSRSMKVQPSYLQSKTGLNGFNAGVRSGRPVDAWAMVNYLHDRYPDTHQSYFWMLDVEAFRDDTVHSNLFTVPALASYFPASVRNREQLSGYQDLFSWQAAKDSFDVVKARIEHGTALTPLQLKKQKKTGEFAPDGYRYYDWNDEALAAGKSVNQRVKGTTKQYVAEYQGYNQLAPMQKTYFEKTLAAMNSWGSAPLIVISPEHPRMLAALKKVGWDARHQQVLDYLDSLHSRYRFTVVDETSISSFGGSPNLFFDGVHMQLGNLHRMIDKALAEAPDALQ